MSGIIKTKSKTKRFSYSKINTFKSCGWKYKLTYVDGHYTYSDSLASELGTLIHHMEETIFNSLKNKEAIDYEKLRQEFQDINIPKTSPYDTNGGIYGINILKEKYKQQFYEVNDQGVSYYTKTLDYLSDGIYRLENFFKNNPNLVPFEAEKHFEMEYHDSIISGDIDRILYDQVNDLYIIEDIKTKDKPFKDDDLITPLQFVIYALALNKCLEIPIEKIKCYYDLPILGMRQAAGSIGFVKRGERILERLFNLIEEEDWEPSPSPLCAWCSYSPTNPEQPEAGKNLCPYYSLWTRESRTREVKNKWQGKEQHDLIMKKEFSGTNNPENSLKIDEFGFDFEF